MRFTWDLKKAATNLKDHRISFAEADSDLLRLISARKTTKQERKRYEENLKSLL